MPTGGLMKRRNRIVQSFLLIAGITFTVSMLAQDRSDYKSESFGQRKKIILWDLGHVLVEPNVSKIMVKYVFRQTFWLNPLNLVRLAILYREGCLDSRALQSTMDEIMHNARLHEPRQTMIVDQHGNFQSNIDADWQVASKSEQELYVEIKKSIKVLARLDKRKSAGKRFFKNIAHRFLIEKILEFRFMTPHFFGRSFTPIKEGVELLAKCKKAGHQVAILSNWGADSFPHLKNHAPNNVIFKHFNPEHIFVSGLIKKAKPYQHAYEHVIDSMGVQPEDVIFIDDQIHNIQAAKKLGIHGIHIVNHKDPQSFRVVEQELIRLGALGRIE